jgi:nucleotide-binding universal stress UspA family protein
MYRTILVPLDGSTRAEVILPHVEEVAHRYDARVILLRVVEPIPVAMDGAGVAPAVDTLIIDQLTNDAKSYLARLQEEFREKGIVAKSRVTFGPAVPTILDLAQREHVDLIAMASHGRSGLPRVFYGSVAAGVLHGVDRPLLLVRSKGPE